MKLTLPAAWAQAQGGGLQVDDSTFLGPRWQARIAVNTCIDRLRRQKSRPEVRFADQSPLVVPLRSLEGLGEPDDVRGRLDGFYGQYLDTLADDHRHLLGHTAAQPREHGRGPLPRRGRGHFLPRQPALT